MERTSHENTTSAVPSHFELFRTINKLSSRVDELKNCLKNIGCQLNQSASSSSPIRSASITVPATQECASTQSDLHTNQEVSVVDEDWIQVRNGPSREIRTMYLLK